MSHTKEFGKAVIAMLKKRQMQLSDLAEPTGLSLRTLEGRLKGKGTFTLDECFAISRALRVPLSAIIRDAEVEIMSHNLVRQANNVTWQ